MDTFNSETIDLQTHAYRNLFSYFGKYYLTFEQFRFLPEQPVWDIIDISKSIFPSYNFLARNTFSCPCTASYPKTFLHSITIKSCKVIDLLFEGGIVGF